MSARDQQPVTIERLERALVLLAYAIEEDGPVHAPLYEKFEAELEAMKRQASTVSRAKQRLESYLAAETLRAIR